MVNPIADHPYGSFVLTEQPRGQVPLAVSGRGIGCRAVVDSENRVIQFGQAIPMNRQQDVIQAHESNCNVTQVIGVPVEAIESLAGQTWSAQQIA